MTPTNLEMQEYYNTRHSATPVINKLKSLGEEDLAKNIEQEIGTKPTWNTSRIEELVKGAREVIRLLKDK